MNDTNAIPYLGQLERVNDYLTGAPAGILTIVICIVAGWGLKMVKRFPNEAIPLVVLLVGAVWFMLMAPSKAADMPTRIWLARNFAIGVGLAFIAWAVHKLVLSRIEDGLPLIGRLLSRGAGDPPARS